MTRDTTALPICFCRKRKMETSNSPHHIKVPIEPIVRRTIMLMFGIHCGERQQIYQVWPFNIIHLFGMRSFDGEVVVSEEGTGR